MIIKKKPSDEVLNDPHNKGRKPLNEGTFYIGSQRDKRNHSEWVKKDPNDPLTMEEILELPWRERFDALTVRHFQTEAWIRGEEYPMPYQIRMPEEGDVLCEELMKEFNV